MDLEQPELNHMSPPPKWTTMCSQNATAATAAPAAASNVYQKVPHPRSPCSSSGIKCTSAFSASAFHLSSTVRTPPAKRFQRVRNPFETALAERMQVPLIGSPSLFQRPVTPQHSSTQFEWTIDEVSSLKPAHVEPHETQFHDSLDPDFEDKVQSAISSYFKEQQIVPSPVECPLRNGRIILSELNGNTPISKPGRRIRDCGTQTELSLPAVLPKALEEALRPYLQPQLTIADVYVDDVRCVDKSLSASDTKDVSLRRKLFDMQNVIVVDSLDGTHFANHKHQQQQRQQHQKNSSPLSMTHLQHTAIIGKLSDSLDKSSFGSLSPISATDGLSISPHSPRYKDSGSSGCGSASKRAQNSRLPRFLNELDDIEQLSPIHPPVRKMAAKRQPLQTIVDKQNYRELNNTADNTFAELAATSTTTGRTTSSATSGSDHSQLQEKFTPERSSSPVQQGAKKAELSVDSSFSMRVSRLMVNSSQCAAIPDNGQRSRLLVMRSHSADADLLMHDDTGDMLDVDDDDMQVSQLSMQSSSSNSDTPRSKRRSASRKNLSQSFTSNWLENEEEEAAQRNAGADVNSHEHERKFNIPELHEFLLLKQQQQQQQLLHNSNSCEANSSQQNLATAAATGANAGLAFYRVDSGFNEMTTSSFGSVLHADENCTHAAMAMNTATTITTIEESTQHDDMSLACCSTPSKRGDATTSSDVF